MKDSVILQVNVTSATFGGTVTYGGVTKDLSEYRKGNAIGAMKQYAVPYASSVNIVDSAGKTFSYYTDNMEIVKDAYDFTFTALKDCVIGKIASSGNGGGDSGDTEDYVNLTIIVKNLSDPDSTYNPFSNRFIRLGTEIVEIDGRLLMGKTIDEYIGLENYAGSGVTYIPPTDEAYTKISGELVNNTIEGVKYLSKLLVSQYFTVSVKRHEYFTLNITRSVSMSVNGVLYSDITEPKIFSGYLNNDMTFIFDGNPS